MQMLRNLCSSKCCSGLLSEPILIFRCAHIFKCEFFWLPQTCESAGGGDSLHTHTLLVPKPRDGEMPFWQQASGQAALLPLLHFPLVNL
jgi:hypothetical protein